MSQKPSNAVKNVDKLTEQAIVSNPSVVDPKAIPSNKEEALKMTAADLLKAYGNKSNAIRAMAAMNCTTGEISKQLGIIYQHARNVLKRPLKRQGQEVLPPQAAPSAPGRAAQASDDNKDQASVGAAKGNNHKK